MARRRRTPVQPTTTPMVVAHRGDSALLAEHTLDAYVAAIDTGADALECDVRLTRDGHLVCVHDRRVDRTSDGQGVVSELDLSRLRDLDFASWHELQDGAWGASADHLLGDEPYQGYLAGVAPDRLGPDGGVLTLDRLLRLVADAERPVKMLIETKHPTRYSGLVEKELVRLLGRYGWDGRVPAQVGRATVMSFAPTAVRRVRLLAPAVPTVLLLRTPPVRGQLAPMTRSDSIPPGVTIAGPGLRVLEADPGYVERAHARGHPVYVWTVDSRRDVEFVLDLGVDAIITNRPGDVARAVAARR